jgi:putative phage-type endonuclease
MKKHLKVYHMKEHSPEWYAFRENGIGGSECANAIGMGHPKYSCPAVLYHEKVGTHPPIQKDNERMFWGRKNEDNIAEVWKYYDNTTDGYIENYKNKTIVRNCRNVNGYVVNPNYPWLFASLDRVMNKEGGINFITAEPLEQEAILECKNVGQYAANTWEDGIPMYFLIQVHEYMIVLETDYAEVAMLVDGGRLEVVKLNRDDKLCEQIIRMTKSFWYDRVVPAKEAFAKQQEADKAGNMNESEKHEAIIQHLEPEPNDSEAYNAFMNEKFVKERESVQGNMDLLKLGRKYHLLNKIIKKLDAEKQLIKNVFAKFLTVNGSESVDFGSSGRINWSSRKGSSSRTFGNKLKEKPSDDIVEDEVSKLDLDCF